jgi:hypothetical protein
MSSSESQELPVSCFLSYRRADNDVFRGVVDQLKSDLAGRFEAETGRGLNIFVDRDDIGWGDDWRQKIFDSIKAATFFVPVITMRYFTSEPCRDEFTAFHEGAKRIGVTGLIRPVILAGGGRIVKDSPDEQMRILFGLNHVSIEHEFDEGFDSPSWHKKIKYMVREFAHGIEEVETILASRESASAAESAETKDAEEPGESYADLHELQCRIEVINGEMTEAIGRDLKEVTEVLEPALNTAAANQPPAKQRAVMLAAAHSLREPAAKFAESAASLETEVVEVDSNLRLALAELSSMESEAAREVIDSLGKNDTAGPGLEEFNAAFVPVSDGMRMLGMININMRKASQPVLQGLQSLKHAVEVLDSWSRLGERPDAD